MPPAVAHLRVTLSSRLVDLGFHFSAQKEKFEDFVLPVSSQIRFQVFCLWRSLELLACLKIEHATQDTPYSSYHRVRRHSRTT